MVRGVGSSGGWKTGGKGRRIVLGTREVTGVRDQCSAGGLRVKTDSTGAVATVNKKCHPLQRKKGVLRGGGEGGVRPFSTSGSTLIKQEEKIRGRKPRSRGVSRRQGRRILGPR